MNEISNVRFVLAQMISEWAPFIWQSYEPGLASSVQRFQGRRNLASFEIAQLAENFETLMPDLRKKFESSQSDVRTSGLDIDAVAMLEHDALQEALNYLHGIHLDLRQEKITIDRLPAVLRKVLSSALESIPLVEPFELKELPVRWASRYPEFMARRVLDKRGNPVSRDSNKPLWLTIRQNGVTATDANRLLRLDGGRLSTWGEVLMSKSQNYMEPHFSSFDLGIEREPVIAQWVEDSFPEEGFEPTDFLFAGDDHRHLATPDMIGNFCSVEIKVSTKPLRQALNKYLDQLYWQMHVLGSDRALFVVENRLDQNKEFHWVARDNKRIDLLVNAAEELLDEIEQR